MNKTLLKNLLSMLFWIAVGYTLLYFDLNYFLIGVIVMFGICGLSGVYVSLQMKSFNASVKRAWHIDLNSTQKQWLIGTITKFGGILIGGAIQFLINVLLTH